MSDWFVNILSPALIGVGGGFVIVFSIMFFLGRKERRRRRLRRDSVRERLLAMTLEELQALPHPGEMVMQAGLSSVYVIERCSKNSITKEREARAALKEHASEHERRVLLSAEAETRARRARAEEEALRSISEAFRGDDKEA